MDSMFSTLYFCPCYDFDFIHISLFQYTIFAKPKWTEANKVYFTWSCFNVNLTLFRHYATLRALLRRRGNVRNVGCLGIVVVKEEVAVWS